jgi:hypothetical protein
MRRSSIRSVFLFVAGLAILGAVAPAMSRDLYVRNSGLDSAHCGFPQDACRTINRAIAHAAAGDNVWVGPGRYGDLNGDGDLNDAQEEHLQKIGTVLCMICITKSIHLYSLFGPEVTQITAPASQNPVGIALVYVIASDVTIGSLGHGFTFRGGDRSVEAEGTLDWVRVIGNIAVQGGNTAFSFSSLGRGLIVANNRAIDSSVRGFMIYGGADAWIYRNIVDGAGYAGFWVVSGEGKPHQVVENVASNSLYGFLVEQRTLMKNNSAISNHVGIRLPGEDSAFPAATQIFGNTIAGNDYAGIEIQAASPGMAINRNNIYGNGAAGLNSLAGSAAGCGIVNYAGGIAVNATNNYWGSAAGPGVDPANKAGPGSGCDLGSGHTLLAPFSVAAFWVLPVTGEW